MRCRAATLVREDAISSKRLQHVSNAIESFNAGRKSDMADRMVPYSKAFDVVVALHMCGLV